MEFLNKMWKFQGRPRKGIYRGEQEKIMWNFHKSQIQALEFPRGVTQVSEIPGVKLHFVWNFLGQSNKPKFPVIFSKIISSTPHHPLPVWIFLGAAECKLLQQLVSYLNKFYTIFYETPYRMYRYRRNKTMNGTQYFWKFPSL